MEEKEMSFVETMEYIDSLRAYGVVPGLDNMRRLCARLENPQDDLKFVHIAGTNGKGSVLCFLSAVLEWEAIPPRLSQITGTRFRQEEE